MHKDVRCTQLTEIQVCHDILVDEVSEVFSVLSAADETVLLSHFRFHTSHVLPQRETDLFSIPASNKYGPEGLPPALHQRSEAFDDFVYGRCAGRRIGRTQHLVRTIRTDHFSIACEACLPML